jgi:hypothetical protein
MRTPNPFEACPECGAPPHVAHLETCQYSYDANVRSKMKATEREAPMQTDPQPQPVPAPDDPDPDGDNGDDAEGDE